jgi:predicted metal-binding membrane protein
MTEALLEVLLRRDRIIVAVALAVLTALAWTDVLWLTADMGMGGMEMTGFPPVLGSWRLRSRRGKQSNSHTSSPCGR